VGANACVGRVARGQGVICIHNPVIGREKELAALQPATTRRKVVVVGGGPAGLEAARVAAARGHSVVVFEKEPKFGGQVRIAALAPHRAAWGQIAAWLERQCRKLGVDMRPSTRGTVESVLAERPDVVIVATGSEPHRPDVPGAAFGNVLSEREVLLGRPVAGQRVVVVDDSHDQEALSTAEHLADQGRLVEVVSRGLYVGADIDMSTLPPLYARLLEKGVALTPNMRLRSIEEDAVVLENVWSHQTGRIGEVDTVVLAVGSRSDDGLYHQLKGRVPELHLVGDAVAPRRLAHAMLEATRVGRLI
jgi:thioredoxin reductase